MKKFLLSGLLVLTFGFYVLHRSNSNKATPTVNTSSSSKVAQQTETPTTISSATENPTSTPTVPAATTTPAPTPKPTRALSQSSGYKDGSYTGSVADAFYGNVQVKATFAKGKLTDVQFLQYPTDRQTSQEISAQATPALRSEAIQAQSATVDIVSGATQTSQAFQQSLQSAFDQAKA